MKPRLLIIRTIFGLAIGLLPFSAAVSQEQTMEVTAGADATTSNVTGNAAKAREYKDKRTDGIYGNFNATYDTPGYFLRMQGSDVGYDTQHYRLEGGPYGKYKYWFDYNEIIHNQTFDAKTNLKGVGEGTVYGATNNLNPNTWTSVFDYSTKRKRFDTGAKISAAKPFFFDVTYNYEKKDGIRPYGVRAPRNMELPEPINYVTNGFKVETGYGKSPFFLSLSYMYDNFRDGYSELSIPSATNGTGRTTLTLPPDNNVQKLGLKGNAKLPLNSKLSVNLIEGRGTSGTGNSPTFDGKVSISNYDIAFNSAPLRFLDIRAYYKYHLRDNRSDGGNPANPPIALYYKSQTAGGEAGLKLPAKFYLDAGYRNVQSDRRVANMSTSGPDPVFGIPYNTDNIYFTNLRWNGLDFMSARVGYELLSRGADYRNNADAAGELARKAAWAAQDRNTFKTVIDFFPTDNLNFGFEYDYKQSTYNDTRFGLKDDTRHSFNFTTDYSPAKITKFFGYFDYEDVLANQSGSNNGDKFDQKLREKNFGYGVRGDVYAIPKKLTFILQGDYLRAHGTTDFTFYNNPSMTGNVAGVPTYIPNADSYQKYSLRFTTVYNLSDRLMLRAGYSYERYIYSDVWYNNYQYTALSNSTLGTVGTVLSGANSRPSYSANTVFAGLVYQFK